MKHKYNDDGSVSIDCYLYNKKTTGCKWASCPLKLMYPDPSGYSWDCKIGVFRISWISFIKHKNILG